jgi:hypothetical protein
MATLIERCWKLTACGLTCPCTNVLYGCAVVDTQRGVRAVCSRIMLGVLFCHELMRLPQIITCLLDACSSCGEHERYASGCG